MVSCKIPVRDGRVILRRRDLQIERGQFNDEMQHSCHEQR